MAPSEVLHDYDSIAALAASYPAAFRVTTAAAAKTSTSLFQGERIATPDARAAPITRATVFTIVFEVHTMIAGATLQIELPSGASTSDPTLSHRASDSAATCASVSRL
jgi:hypothetical protein